MTRTGTVFVTWRQFEFKPNQGQQQRDAIAWVRSTDGGASFTKPAIAQEFTHWDMGDEAGNPVANGQARYESCRPPTGRSAGVKAPSRRSRARDCGDGPLVCQSGYVFGHVNSAPRNAADPVQAKATSSTSSSRQPFPERERPTGTTYGTIGRASRSQGAIYSRRPRTAGERGRR